MKKTNRVPEPPEWAYPPRGGCIGLQDEGFTAAMTAAIAEINASGNSFWIASGILEGKLRQAFNNSFYMQAIDTWLRKCGKPSTEHEVIFWLTVSVLGEWQRLPKHTGTEHRYLYSQIQKLCRDLRQALGDTKDSFDGGTGRGLATSYVLDYLRKEESKPLADAILAAQRVRGHNESEIFPRLTVEQLLKRIEAAASERENHGPAHTQPKKKGAERGYFVRRMGQLFMHRYGERPREVLAALTSIALEVTDVDLVSKLLQSS